MSMLERGPCRGKGVGSDETTIIKGSVWKSDGAVERLVAPMPSLSR